MGHVPSNNVFGLPEFDFTEFSGSPVFYRNGEPISMSTDWTDTLIACFTYEGQLHILFASKTNKGSVWAIGSGYQALWTMTGPVSVRGDNVCTYMDVGSASDKTTDYPVTVWTGQLSPTDYKNKLGWLMLYGGYSGYSVTYDLENCTGAVENPTIISPEAIITSATFTPDTSFNFNSGSVWIDGSGFEGATIQYTWESEIGLLRIGIITSNITVHVHAYTDPYNNPDNPDLIDGESDIPGGDIIGIPGLPGISAVTSGVVGLFNPSVQQMQSLSDFMWTDFGGTATTTDDILKEIVQAIKRTISNPLDYIIGLNIIPSQGLSVGSTSDVRFGFVSSGVSMPKLTSQYFVVDCGTLSFDKLCGDTFLDYAPYSKFTLYLPYIGVKEMDANDFVGHTIGIVYHGDVVTGGITAYVLKDGSVMYQYAGCCALTVPINADSWGNVVSGAVQIATSIVAGGVMAGGAGATIATAKGAADVASNPSMLSPQVLRSGAVSGGAGCMAVQKPFVIREAVRFHSTNGFNTVSGYPAYYYKTLFEMHGFTSVLDVHLHGIPATDSEISEIENLLKEGVIL